MSTILNKDLIRETTVQSEGKNIIITLTENQEIEMSLKGSKNKKPVKISIDGLYRMLNDGDVIPPKGSKENPMISLYDLSSALMVKDIPYKVKVDLNNFILSLIEIKK